MTTIDFEDFSACMQFPKRGLTKFINHRGHHTKLHLSGLDLCA